MFGKMSLRSTIPFLRERRLTSTTLLVHHSCDFLTDITNLP